MKGERKRISPEKRSTERKAAVAGGGVWESAGTIREIDEYGVVGLGFS